ncbi:caspase recruitment domain-containing protein 19 isoform X2 [Zonotrichia leucophrys gambelii]|uniref:caspase recruitment domain-containing protein 19 isoform X2 n=1 Tax=Zonotrichia leucophrys gambelii TaxID=257770 RepID=UPI00313FF6A8
MADQSYCHRLQHDMYFLTSTSRLNEQVVDKIVLQLNRVYPQILTNEEAEKFRNPKASLHTRLSDLLKHLQKKGDRHCQEFYRALQINAEQLFNDLPSRKILKTPDPTEIDTDKEQYMLNDRGPVFFLACFSVAAGLALFWYCCNSGACFSASTSLQHLWTVIIPFSAPGGSPCAPAWSQVLLGKQCYRLGNKSSRVLDEAV